jgi:hypothetical protein
MHEHRVRRERLPREERRRGLDVLAFCRSRGLSPSSFHRWRRILAGGEPPPGRRGAGADFVELVAPPSISGPAVVIPLAGGRRIEVASGVDEAWLARLFDRLDRTRDEAAS